MRGLSTEAVEKTVLASKSRGRLNPPAGYIYQSEEGAWFIEWERSQAPEESESAVSQQSSSSAGLVQADRRSRTRYPIELEVRFFLTRQKSRQYSVGRTVNISSSGLLISSPCLIGVAAQVQLMIDWPSLLDGRIPLQLVATGTVVRSGGWSFAVAVRSHQFRTMKRSLAVQAQPPASVSSAQHEMRL